MKPIDMIKEFLLWVGWALAALFGYLNYRQSHELRRLRQRINDTEEAQLRDHELYRKVLIDFGQLFGNEIQSRNITARVDAIFQRAFEKADKDVPPPKNSEK